MTGCVTNTILIIGISQDMNIVLLTKCSYCDKHYDNMLSIATADLSIITTGYDNRSIIRYCSSIQSISINKLCIPP